MNDLVKSDCWKEEWRARIGGGRAAAAAGIHEYMTRYELYRSMVEEVEMDLSENPNLLRGILLEPVCMQRLQMLHPDLHFEAHDQNQFVYNPAYPFASDLPDLHVSLNRKSLPVQCKVPTPENWQRLEFEIPDYIRANCVHSVAVNGSESILLACLNPVTMEVFQSVITPSQQEIDCLMSAEERFWINHIVPRIPPPLKTSNDIKLRWPDHVPGLSKVATPDIEDICSELRSAKAASKRQQEQIDELTDAVKVFMEDAEILLPEDGNKPLATWRTQTARVFDTAAFKKDHPQAAKEYYIDRDSRVFLVKKPS